MPPGCQAPAAASELGSKQGGYAPTRNLLRCLSVLQQEETPNGKANGSVGLQPHRRRKCRLVAERFMKSEMGLVINIVLGIIEPRRQLANGLPRHFASGGWIGYLIAGFIGFCTLSRCPPSAARFSDLNWRSCYEPFGHDAALAHESPPAGFLYVRIRVEPPVHHRSRPRHCLPDP